MMLSRSAVLLVLVPWLLVGAQDTQDDPAVLLEAARERLEQMGDPPSTEDGAAGEDATQAAWRAAVTARITTLQGLVDTRTRSGELSSKEDLEERRARAQASLDSERAAVPQAVTLDDTADLSTYESAQRDADAAKSEQKQTLEDSQARLTDAEAELEKLGQGGAAYEALLARDPPTEEVDRYRYESARYAKRADDERATYLKRASSFWIQLQPVLQVESDLAALREERASARLDEARAAAEVLREAAATRATEQADEARQAAEREQDPVERFRQHILAETQDLVAEIASIQILHDQLEDRIRTEVEAIDLAKQEEDHVDKRMQLRMSGRADVVLSAYERTKRSRELLRGSGLDEEISAHEARLAQVLDRLWDALLPPDENPDLLALKEEVPSGAAESAKAAFDEVVTGDGGLVDTLRDTRAAMDEANQRYGRLTAAALERRAVLDDLLFSLQTKLFWRRSAPLLFGPQVTDSFGEADRLSGEFSVSGTWTGLRGALGIKPIWSWAAGLLLVCALALHRPLRRALSQPVSGRKLAEVGRLVLSLTWMSSLPAVFLLSSLIAEGTGNVIVQGAVARLLFLQGWILLGRRAADVLLAPGGYARRGEVVAADVAEQLERGLRLMTLGGLVLWAPAMALRIEPLQLSVLPRLLDVAWLLTVGVVAVRLLSWGGALVRRWSTSATLRAVMRCLMPLILFLQVASVVLAVLGYEVASRYIGTRTLVALGVMIGLSWLYTLSVRMAGRFGRRVHARVSQTHGDEAASDQADAIVSAIAQVSGVLVTVAAFIGLQAATGTLGIIATWLSEVTISTGGEEDWLSAWDIALALIWVLGGHLLASQTGRLYEQVIIPLVGEGERGARFALLTLFRYAVVLVTWLLALTTLGLSMENVGWLMTAVSVGLGFGLQEIVANFVSGLILLFERPVRVGDVITVGQTGGTVDRIQIRATVVTNWERQVIVIPNKLLITQNLTNWTRNDRVVRKTLPLKVAYGADIERVLKLVDEVVRNHPRVLEDPPHRVWFNGFGDYSLDLDVWFFCQLEDGLTTRSELHKELYTALAREGIDIPVPLQDVRLHEDVRLREEGSQD